MAKPHSASEPLKVRLNCLDHYQAAPSAFDSPLWGPQTISSTQRGNLPRVPIIRVFGATHGEKVCAHIHGAFPYLYVPYTDSLDQNEVNQYIRTLRHSIDHVLALPYRRNPYDNDPKKTTFVAHISLVKGVPFFGYHVGYNHYMRVYLLNPAHMTRFTDLLQQGAIMARPFQPYEAHLQYLLQWMCDFNVHGCARCHLEIDLRVEDIINRHDIQPRNLHHSSIERLASLENLLLEEKLVHSMAGLWKDETKRRKKRLGIPVSDALSTPYPPEVLVSMSADPRNDSAGGWIHEEEFHELVDELANEERKARGGGDLSFESVIAPRQEKAAGKEDAGSEVKREVEWRNGIKHEQAADAMVDMSSIVPHTSLDEEEDDDSDEDVARTKALTQRQKLKDAGLDGAMAKDKVNGSASEIECRAERLNGACIPATTVNAAKQDTSLKRPAVSNSSQGRFKRPKVRAADDIERPTSRHVAFHARDVRPGIQFLAPDRAPDDEVTTDVPPSSQRRKPVNDRLGIPPPSYQAPPQERTSKEATYRRLVYGASS
ncbi:DNA polymerase zeta [Friedmanniomyces endolithicus]|nr:DNA polymerase zeta [Friedmanniomyces endolithicus]KAK0268065.1 DNA polymerase zeta [Friedmanniomyces endolithicus]KAK0971198.1 DNA polymerase zeta [Friedmanniomyces endolithicus]